jgi:hypothetical protein
MAGVGIRKLDHALTIKLSTAQLRECKAAARKRGKLLAVWARDALVDRAGSDGEHAGNGHHARLEAPELPAR